LACRHHAAAAPDRLPPAAPQLRRPGYNTDQVRIFVLLLHREGAEVTGGRIGESEILRPPLWTTLYPEYSIFTS